MATDWAPTQDWNSDPYLQELAIGLLTSAMASGDREDLTGAVAVLRQRGANLARIYPIARKRYPRAPTLDELELASDPVAPGSR